MLAIDNINIKKGLGRRSVSGTPGEVDRSRICGVGDSLDHDILGARSNDIDSIWTANGVHSKEMVTEEGSSVLASKKVLLEMYEKYHITPTHTIPSFKL